MDYPCMVCCRFSSISRAASSRTDLFKCPQNISPFKFARQKISIPLRVGNNALLFSHTPITKRGYVKKAVSASSAANKGEMEDDKGKEMQPKESADDEVKWISQKLLKRDRNAENLGQKLEVIRDLVAENMDDGKLLEALTFAAIYLKWINTSQIPWFEDGEPKKYEISRDIFRHLERIYSRKDIPVEEVLVIRKIHPCLASLKDEFSTCVPIIRTGEDFNAGRSLQELLEPIRDTLNPSSTVLLRFLESKQKLDDTKDILEIGKGKWMTRLMNGLQALDILRQEIVQVLKSELENDAFDTAVTLRQQLRLCEIGLEDYSSLLLSRFLNSLEDAGGASWLAENVDLQNLGSWNQPLGALIIAIHQLGLSGWKPEECTAITNELKAWQEIPLLETEGGEDGKRIWGLSLKATLDRAERLTEDYSEALLNIFPEKVEMLGKDFGIIDSRYTEAEIHAGVIFQVSNLCTLLSKAVRKVVGGRRWDILVPGAAFGKLIQVENIGSIPPSETEPLIVVVDKARGDEEVEAAEAEIGGVILLQGLPRLSHLVLTARKKEAVVVTCEDDEECSRIRRLSGGVVNLEATFSNGVSLKPPDSSRSTPDFSTLPRNLSNADSTESNPRVKAVETYTVMAKKVGAVRVEEAEKLANEERVGTENMFGAEAASCCRLASLATELGHVEVPASFKVPKGAVIPFGSIEEAVGGDGYYRSLVEKIETATWHDEIRRLREELQAFVSRLCPSEGVMRELSKIFPHNALLILRSSASVEDSRGIQVAGRDDPIITASLSNPSLLREAIGRVWASLYTPEASRSRRAAQVSERVADMAVLVQEMLFPDLSFVLHIVSPTDDSKVLHALSFPVDTEVVIELAPEEKKDFVDINIKAAAEEERKYTITAEIAPGLGKTLFVDTRASPWRFSYYKTNNTVETLAFANYSEELAMSAADGRVLKLTVDYSKKPLTMDSQCRQKVGRRLGAIGLFLAKKLRGRWDVEGSLVGDDIYIVQMRRNHGL